MKIQKGLVKYKDRSDIICTYGITDDGRQFYFLNDSKLSNNNIIVTSTLVEAIDATVAHSNVGVIDAEGNIVIPCENRNIKLVTKDILLVEKSTPISQCVIDAVETRKDPLAATKLVSTTALVKDKVFSEMGTDGRFLFNDQFSEASLYDLNGNNLVDNRFYSFIAINKNSDTIYLSDNTKESALDKFSLTTMTLNDTTNVPTGEVPQNAGFTDIDVNDVSVNKEEIDNAMNEVEAQVAGENIVQENVVESDETPIDVPSSVVAPEAVAPENVVPAEVAPEVPPMEENAFAPEPSETVVSQEETSEIPADVQAPIAQAETVEEPIQEIAPVEPEMPMPPVEENAFEPAVDETVVSQEETPDIPVDVQAPIAQPDTEEESGFDNVVESPQENEVVSTPYQDSTPIEITTEDAFAPDVPEDDVQVPQVPAEEESEEVAPIPEPEPEAPVEEKKSLEDEIDLAQRFESYNNRPVREEPVSIPSLNEDRYNYRDFENNRVDKIEDDNLLDQVNFDHRFETNRQSINDLFGDFDGYMREDKKEEIKPGRERQDSYENFLSGLTRNDNVKNLDVRNNTYEDVNNYSAPRNNTAGSIMDSAALTISKLIEANKTQSNELDEYKHQVQELTDLNRKVVDRAKEDRERIRSSMQNYEDQIERLKAQMDSLEDRVRDKDRIINSQTAELSNLRSQVEGSNNLAKILEDAQSILGNNRY